VFRNVALMRCRMDAGIAPVLPKAASPVWVVREHIAALRQHRSLPPAGGADRPGAVPQAITTACHIAVTRFRAVHWSTLTPAGSSCVERPQSGDHE